MYACTSTGYVHLSTSVCACTDNVYVQVQVHVQVHVPYTIIYTCTCTCIYTCMHVQVQGMYI